MEEILFSASLDTLNFFNYIFIYGMIKNCFVYLFIFAITAGSMYPIFKVNEYSWMFPIFSSGALANIGNGSNFSETQWISIG